MDYDLIPKKLARVENLKQFAERAGMHRRTLQRIIAGAGSPNTATLAMIAQKLKEIRPKLRPKPAEPPPQGEPEAVNQIAA